MEIPMNYWSNCTGVNEKVQIDTSHLQRIPELIDEKKPNKLKALIFMVIAILCFGSTNISCMLGFAASPNLSILDYLLVKGWGMLTAGIIIWTITKSNVIQIQRQILPLFIACVFLGRFAANMFFYAVENICLFKSTLIYNTNAIFATIWSGLFLGEKITVKDMLWIAGAFVGLSIMWINNFEPNAYGESEVLPVAMCMCASLLFSGTPPMMKYMGLKVNCVIFHFILVLKLVFMTSVPWLYYPSVFQFNEYTLSSTILFAASGVLHNVAYTLMGIAFTLADMSKNIHITHLQLIVNLSVDMAVFGYTFGPTDIIGAVIIVISLIILIRESNNSNITRYIWNKRTYATCIFQN